MSSENRRKFQRVLFDADTKILADAGNTPVQLIDISLNGVLLQSPENWHGKVDQELPISIQLDQDEEFIIHMQAKIAHIEDGHIGLHCEHIDMDSITYLRRLVELNLGDADLLERELVSLG